jgi:hypothetical protein
MAEKLKSIPPFYFVGVVLLVAAVLYTFAPADRASALQNMLTLIAGGFLALINPKQEKQESEKPSLT